MLHYELATALVVSLLAAVGGQTQPDRRPDPMGRVAAQDQGQRRHAEAVTRLPQDAVSAIEKALPGAVIVDVDREEGQNAWDVEVLSQDKLYNVLVDDRGRILHRKLDRRESRRLASLPDPVKKTVKEKYPDAVIYGAEQDVENHQKVYDLDLLTRGRKMNVKVTPAGRLVEATPDDS